jgi:4-azaleucine resistance transporter AzlC
MINRFKTLSRGIIDVSPLMIPVFPFGIIYGVIGMDLGIGPYMTLGLSIIIFGGASQIVLLQLFSGGASSLVILSSVGAVNSRHILYGAVLSEHLSSLKITWKIILSYVMVDQAFAVSNTYFNKNKKNQNKHYHLLGAGFTCWTIWQLSTILGIVLGSVVPEELGLSFTISLTFLALLINDLRKFKNIIVMLTSGIVATVGFSIIPFQAYIIVAAISALFVATLLTLIEFKKKK